MQHSSTTLPVILTGDRTTGPLHLGHYVGSLKNRVTLQTTHRQYLLLADTQALTDNAHDPGRVRDNVLEIATDYLAVGIDPDQTTICLQSHLPALAELTLLYMNFVTVARLERNPTIKDEIQARGFGRDIPAGFLCYPVAQAADITAFKATRVQGTVDGKLIKWIETAYLKGDDVVLGGLYVARFKADNEISGDWMDPKHTIDPKGPKYGVPGASFTLKKE